MSNLNKKRQITEDILRASFSAGACHISSALSCADILVNLFYGIIKSDDVFLFSKASGVATLYAILADKGFFSKEQLADYLKNYPLPSKEVPGVIWSGGSLGMGLPVAVGLALADRTRNVYVLISDGEVQEGTTWESALFARQHKLNNLFVICDNNKYQAIGETKDILELSTAFKFLVETFPNFQVVDTVKGGNIPFLQGTKGHYHNLTEDELNQALCLI